MSRNSERDFLRARLFRVQKLLAACPESAVFERASLLAHQASVKAELDALPEDTDVPRLGETALLFEGEPVRSVVGIRADFAPKAIEGFQELVSARQIQVAKRLPKKDRINFHPKPLMITGVARGSFGFQFQEAEDAETARLLGDSCTQEAIRQSVEIIEIFRSSSDAELPVRVKNLDQRSIHAVSTFFDHAKDSRATVKIETDGMTISLDVSDVLLVADRSKRVSKEDEPDEICGILTGLMINARRFEFQPEDGKCFSGSISDTADPASFACFLKIKCIGVFRKSRELKQGKGQKPRWKWELLDLMPPTETQEG